MSDDREVLSFDELHAADIKIQRKSATDSSAVTQETNKAPTPQETSSSLADVEHVFDYKHQPNEQQEYELKLKDFVGMLEFEDRLYTRRKSRFNSALSTQEAVTVDKAAIIDQIKAEVATEKFSLAERNKRRLFIPYALMYIDNDAVTLRQSLNSLAQYCDRGVLLFSRPLPEISLDKSLEIAQEFVEKNPGFKIVHYPLPILPRNSKVVLDRFANSELHRYWLLDLVYNYGLLHLKTLANKNNELSRALLFMAKPTVIYEPRLLEYAHRYIEQAAQFYDCVYLNDLSFVSETPEQFFTNLDHVHPQTEQNITKAEQRLAQQSNTVHETAKQVEANSYVKVYGKTAASQPQAFADNTVNEFEQKVSELSTQKASGHHSTSATSFNSDVAHDPISEELKAQNIAKRVNDDITRLRDDHRAERAKEHLIQEVGDKHNGSIVSETGELTKDALDNQFALATENKPHSPASSHTTSKSRSFLSRIKDAFLSDAEKVLEVESQHAHNEPFDLYDANQKRAVEQSRLNEAQATVQATSISNEILASELEAHPLDNHNTSVSSNASSNSDQSTQVNTLANAKAIDPATDGYSVKSADVLHHHLQDQTAPKSHLSEGDTTAQQDSVEAVIASRTEHTSDLSPLAKADATSSEVKANRRITKLWKQGNSFDPLQFLCRLSCITHFESKVVLPGSSNNIVSDNPYFNRKFIYDVRPFFKEHTSLLSFGLFVGGVDFAHEKAMAYCELDTEYALNHLYHCGAEYHGVLYGFAEYFDVINAFHLPKSEYSVEGLLNLANSFEYPPVSHALLKVVNNDLHQIKAKHNVFGLFSHTNVATDHEDLTSSDRNIEQFKAPHHHSIFGDVFNNLKSHVTTVIHHHPQLTPAVAYDYNSVDYIKLFLGQQYYISEYLGQFNTKRPTIAKTDPLYEQYEDEAKVLTSLFNDCTKDLNFEYSGFEVVDDHRFENKNPREFLKPGQTYVYDRENFFSKLK